MSEAGRDDVWTDLEQLLKEGKLGADSPDEPCPDAGTSVSAEGDEDRAGLPFEDLLTELLDSWEDDRPGQIATSEGNGAEEPQVSLPDLMSRLMEGAETSESETVQSLEALQQRLNQEPPAGDPAQMADPDPAPEAVTPAPFHEIAPAIENQAAADASPAEDHPADFVAPALDEATQAGPDVLLLQASPAIEHEPAADASPAEDHPVDFAAPVVDEATQTDTEIPFLQAAPAGENEPGGLELSPAVRFGDLPAPGLSSGLLKALLSGLDESESGPLKTSEEDSSDPAASSMSGWTDDLLAALVEADESAQPPEVTGQSEETPTFSANEWEAQALLPGPAPSNRIDPSLSETILFEPPLPPDSVLDWPVVERGEGIGGQPQETGQAEEVGAGAEYEVDDSLRRLVGLMLAEIAASASPSEQTPSAETSTERTTERFLSFSLAGEVYAVDLAGILETDRLPRITRVPGLPAWAIGVSNLRGTILPVVDLRRLLNLEESENPSEGRILVARPVSGDPPAALVVDRLEGVALLAPSELHPAPQWLDSKILPYLEGIGSFKGRLVNVLDLGRLFKATGVNGDEPARTSEAA